MDHLKTVHLLVPTAAAAGAAWGTSWAGLATSILLLPCWGLSPSRGTAALVALAYYCGGAREMPAAIEAYYRLGYVDGWLITVCSAGVLALPWAALWAPSSASRGIRAGRAAAALVLSTVPPLGLIGVCNPLALSGTLLPGLGFASVVGTLLLLALSATSPRRAAVLVGVAVVSHHVGSAPTSADWRALDTEIPSVPAPRDYPAQFERALTTLDVLERVVGSDPATTGPHLLLPEAAGGSWTRAMAGVWQPVIERLRQQHRCLVMGVLDPRDGHANGVRAVGDCDGTLRQRVPVPGEQAPRVLGDSVLTVAGERVGVLVCFESHLAWPVIHTALARPSALLVLANVRPIRETRAERAQRVVMTSWARAFDLPLHIATNR